MPNTRERRSAQLHCSAPSRISKKPIAMRIRACRSMLGRLYLADGQHDKAIALLAPFVDRTAGAGRGGRAAGRSVSGDRPRCRGDRAAREIGRGFARAVRRARPGVSGLRAAGSDAAERIRARSKSGRRVCPLRAQWATALLNVGDAHARAKCSKRDRRATQETRARCIFCPKRSAARATSRPRK